jgi:glycosyltransferase involved in cell wall biosynthesis
VKPPRRIRLEPLPPVPRVSILISNYNYRRYVGAAVESVLAQTYPAVEVVVVDDGSVDGSDELLRQYAARHPNVKLLEQPNAGQAAAINAAYRASSGEVVSLLDADDTFAPDKSAAVVQSFQQQPTAGFCIHSLRPVDARGSSIGPSVPRLLERGWIAARALGSGGKTSLPPTTGLSFRRSVAEAILPAPPVLRICADGYLREAAQLITEVSAIDTPLGTYRIHGANLRGGSQLEAKRLRKVIEVEHRLICDSVNQFLDGYCGEDSSARLRAEDAPSYWEKILLIDILDRCRPAVAGMNRDEILRLLPANRRRKILATLGRLPGFMARPAARFLFGDVALRRKLVSALQFARLGVPCS